MIRVRHACDGNPIFRYGGEEFCIVLWEADRVVAEQVATRLQAQIRNLALPHPASPRGAIVSVSIGIACVVPAAECSASGAIQLADEALYEAKARGRDRIVLRDKENASLTTGIFRNSVSKESCAALTSPDYEI